MDNSTFSYDLTDTLEPFDVIHDNLEQINIATKGFVTGQIEEYKGEINSYTRKTGLLVAMETLQGKQVETVDIQDLLGEQNNKSHRYEVYLKAKGLDNYKYRIMFVDYGDISYPVTVVLATKFAHIIDPYTDTFQLKSMGALDDLLHTVIDSDIMVDLIQNLINETLRRQRKTEISNKTN